MARLDNSSISQLNSHAIKQLHSRKIFTIIDFVGESTENLMTITKLPYKDILEIRKQIIDNHVGKVKKAVELLDKERESISTGIQGLDNLINGGLRSGHIYEICGASSSGKSSICLSVSTTIALNTNFVVHYIDTKKDFSSTRVQMILEAKKISTEMIAKVMQQIKVTQIKNSLELFNILHEIKSKSEQIKVIVIDSLPSLFNMSNDNYEAMYSLNHLANVCRYLANEFDLSIITVNLITQWRQSDVFSINNKNIVKPMLGKYWGRIPNIRIYVEQLENERRMLKIWKSLDRKIGASCEIKINNEGIS